MEYTLKEQPRENRNIEMEMDEDEDARGSHNLINM